MIINLKSETDLSGFYVVYEGSTNLEKPETNFAKATFRCSSLPSEWSGITEMLSAVEFTMP